MFESGNIQGRPSAILFIKSSLQTRTWNVGALVASGIVAASYDQVTFNGQAPSPETVKISARLSAAVYFATIEHSSAAPVEAVNISSSIIAADYESTLINGLNQAEFVTVENAIVGANYEQVIFNGGAVETQDLNVNSSITNATYEPA